MLDVLVYGGLLVVFLWGVAPVAAGIAIEREQMQRQRAASSAAKRA